MYDLDITFFNYNNTINSLVKNYSEEFKYIENHKSQFKNVQFSVILYKNKNYINELNLTFPNIHFGNCYAKIQKFYSINNSLIIVTMDEYVSNNSITTNSFFDSNTGTKLDGKKFVKMSI